MLTIYAKYRNDIGTKNTRKLRIQNRCPGIIYGNKYPNITIWIDQNIITNIKNTNKLYENNIQIIINNTKSYIVKIHNIQYHPFKTKIIHIDFIYHMKK